jgi:hypothetical protein
MSQWIELMAVRWCVWKSACTSEEPSDELDALDQAGFSICPEKGSYESPSAGSETVFVAHHACAPQSGRVRIDRTAYSRSESA